MNSQRDGEDCCSFLQLHCWCAKTRQQPEVMQISFHPMNLLAEESAVKPAPRTEKGR